MSSPEKQFFTVQEHFSGGNIHIPEAFPVEVAVYRSDSVVNLYNDKIKFFLNQSSVNCLFRAE